MADRPTPARLAEIRSGNACDFFEVQDRLDQALAEVDALTAEREEARDWVRRLTAAERVLTCAFCGEAYPPGTPETNHERLTAHVFVCEKHPIRRFLVEAVKLTCDPDPDKPPRPSEAVLEKVGDVLETECHGVLGINGLFADFLVKSADELHPLHELVKATGACVCPEGGR